MWLTYVAYIIFLLTSTGLREKVNNTVCSPLFLAGGANRNLAFLLWLYITISARSPEARQFATPDN